jgi:hypothetical protein
LVLDDAIVLSRYGIADPHQPHMLSCAWATADPTAAAAAAAAGTPLPAALPPPSLLPQHLQLNLSRFPATHVRRVHDDPPVFCIADFLPPELCDDAIRRAQASLHPSRMVAESATGKARTSMSCWLTHADLPGLVERVSAVTGKTPSQLEPPQVARYCSGQKYDPHHDAFDLRTEPGRQALGVQGQRVATVLVYLNDVKQPGKARAGQLTAAGGPGVGGPGVGGPGVGGPGVGGPGVGGPGAGGPGVGGPGVGGPGVGGPGVGGPGVVAAAPAAPDASAAAGTSGSTGFQRLGIRVVPRRGMALIFFPTFATDERLDERALHSGDPVVPMAPGVPGASSNFKWVTQVWVRARGVNGES